MHGRKIIGGEAQPIGGRKAIVCFHSLFFGFYNYSHNACCSLNLREKVLHWLWG